jgi:hypothetical protein
MLGWIVQGCASATLYGHHHFCFLLWTRRMGSVMKMLSVGVDNVDEDNDNDAAEAVLL